MTQVKEISKGLAGRYLKKVPASAADAGRKSAGTTGFGSNDQKKNVEKGIKKFVNRNRGTDMAVNKMTGKAKVAATESFVIPEDIPVGERNAFMGAAAAAHKAGKSHFSFAGKKHPVTMKKDTAKAVNSSTTEETEVNELKTSTYKSYMKKSEKDDEKAFQKGDYNRSVKRGVGQAMAADALKRKAAKKEGTDEAKRTVHSNKEDRLVTMKIKNPKKKSGETATMNPKMATASKEKGAEMEQKESLTIRDKLLMVLEGDRSKHYKGAAEAEPMDNNLKGAGAKKMKADIQGNAADPDLEKKSHDDASKAGRAGPSGKSRPNDKKDGDKKVINPPEDATKKGQGSAEVKIESRDQLAGIKAAYAEMQNGN